MDVKLLGSVCISSAGGEVTVPAKERALLAALALRPNRVVPVGGLEEALWGDRPPPTASRSLHSHVSRLRQALPGSAAPRIVKHPRGYSLAAGPDDIDAACAEALLQEGRDQAARGDHAAAATTLRRAEGLWRGPSLVEFAAEPYFAGDAARLDELHLVIVEERVAAELLLGHHSELVGELRARVTDHPLRERLWGHLIVALYRAGRQSEALATYQQLRETLRDQLGVDPSPELQSLETSVLRQDGALQATLTRPEPKQHQQRELVTVMFTDITDSTRMASELGDRQWRATIGVEETATRDAVERWRGEYIKHLGDGSLAVFAVPADAVSCAAELVADSATRGVTLRCGVHTGECERAPRDVIGIAVHVAARLVDVAGPGEVLVSRTVTELTAGSGHRFTARRRRQLAGLDGTWSIARLVRDSAQVTPVGRRKPKEADAPIRVFVVDDHPLWRETVVHVLRARRMQVVGQAGDAADAMALLSDLSPDVVIMDLSLPLTSGAQLTRQLRDRYPSLRVLVLSSSEDGADVVEAVRAGASGYLPKTASSADVVDAVKRVHRGELVFPPGVAQFVLEELRRRDG